MISYGSASLQGWGWIGRARCGESEKPRYKGRPRCDTWGNGCRPRCELWAINRVHLDLAESLYVAHGCNCGVCVGIEYFNYACRHLPSPNFFAQYSSGIPLLTVQKMLRPPKSAPPWAYHSPCCPTLPLRSYMVWFEP